jgi:ferrous iron transport protein A
MISLDRLPPCTPAVVISLPSGRGVAQRLLALGLSPGVEIVNLQNRRRGPLIVQVRGVRLALGRGQAARVRVEPLAAAECAEAAPARWEAAGVDVAGAA